MGLIRSRALLVQGLTLDGDVSTFDAGRFRVRLCSLFTPPCSANDVTGLTASAGSTVLEFTIQYRSVQSQRTSGPTTRHMRARLADTAALSAALAPAFILSPQNADLMRLTELTEHFSNSQLIAQLQSIKTITGAGWIFYLCGLWGLTAFWSITARGRACRARSHSSWIERFVPTTETVQVLVLSSFFQLILCLLCHWALPFMPEAEYTMLTWYLGIVIGVLGACFQSGFNRWVRGESLSLRAALAVDKINKKPGESDGWCDEEREYRCVYEAGSDRALGQLATHDWEQSHMEMERRYGLVDLSDNVFDDAPPERDAGILAAYLNSKLNDLFTSKKEEERRRLEARSKLAPEMHVCAVEVPVGLPRTTLRDALLQWRLRHTAHPVEADAVDWALGQLEPSGFELTAVKVPEQARLLVYDALIQYTQQHAELQLDAAHAARVAASLQQLSPRFEGIEVGLPDDGEETRKVRKLVQSAPSSSCRRRERR